MSGSRGGDYTPIGQPGPCDKLQVETALQSPNPDVLATIRKDDELELQLKAVGNRHAVLVLKGSDVAGSLVFASLQKLVECMQAGYQFVAQVLAISGPSCRLRIRPK